MNCSWIIQNIHEQFMNKFNFFVGIYGYLYHLLNKIELVHEQFMNMFKKIESIWFEPPVRLVVFDHGRTSHHFDFVSQVRQEVCVRETFTSLETFSGNYSKHHFSPVFLGITGLGIAIPFSSELLVSDSELLVSELQFRDCGTNLKETGKIKQVFELSEMGIRKGVEQSCRIQSEEDQEFRTVQLLPFPGNIVVAVNSLLDSFYYTLHHKEGCFY